MRRALPRQAANALRMAYAAHMRAADSTQRRQLSMLEYEKIQQTDIRTPAIMAFADSLLAAQGVSPQGLSAEDKAMALFREQAAGQLVRMTAARNKALIDYMQSTHGAAAPAFRVQAMDSAAMLTYAGRDRYTIAIEVDGETVEVATEDGAPVAGDDTGTADMGAAATTGTAIDAATSTEVASETAGITTAAGGATAAETAGSGEAASPASGTAGTAATKVRR